MPPHTSAPKKENHRRGQFLTRGAMLARHFLSSCVRPSVTSRCCIETTGRIELLARRLPSNYPTLRYKKIWVSPKIRVRYIWNFAPNSELRKFRHGKSIALSTKLVVVVVDGRVCWQHLYDNRRVVDVYYKSINCNPLTITSIFVVDLFYNWFLQLTRFWLTYRASRGPSAVAKLLVCISTENTMTNICSRVS